MGDETRGQSVPLVEGYAGAQGVGAHGAFLALLRLHVQELTLTTGEG